MTPRTLTSTTLLLAAGAAIAAAPMARAQGYPTPVKARPVVASTGGPGHGGSGGGGGAGDTPSGGGDFLIDWTTIDGGGVAATGGDFDMLGTFGQPDAGEMSGDCYHMVNGFWAIVAPPACYANCDNSTQPPTLNVADFTCFLQKYAAGDCYANCDDSTTPPVINVADFTCFLQKYAAGCS